MKRIALVEDHASFRQLMAFVFENQPGFEVVGQAGSLAEAREVLKDLAVDVAVVDLNLPDGEGVEVIEELREANPDAAALVLTASLDRRDFARAVEAGAAGVLHKAAEIEEVLDAVRRLLRGEALLSREEIVEMLRLAGRSRQEEEEVRQVIEQFTRRELEVLQALAEGLGNKEIAEHLHVSLETERSHMSSILTKTGTHSRLQALLFAVRHGLVEVR